MSEVDRERWNGRYAKGDASLRDVCACLRAVEHEVPRRGRALDVAGGTGRHALWLARRGLGTTLVDISDVALAHARAHALEAGVEVQTRRLDLECEPPPEGPWDVIVSVDYLHRPLIATLAGSLSPGGVLVFVQPTAVNLERHPRPSARFLLEPGELARIAADLGPGLQILRLDEGWRDGGRHEAWLVATRPGPAGPADG